MNLQITAPPRWSRLLLAAGPIAVVAGLLAHAMWLHLPRDPFLLAMRITAVVSLLAWPLQRFTPLRWAEAQALLFLGLLAFFVGPLPLASALLLGATALVLGWPWVPGDLRARPALAGLLGLILLGGVAGWLLQLPIHHFAVWAGLCAGVLVLRRRVVFEAVRTLGSGLRGAVDEAPWPAFVAITLIGLASTAAWLPTMQFDDLAYHLSLPAQLLAHAEYRPDPANQVWSLAPWLGDTLQGAAAVLAGSEARGAVNALWLVLGMGAAWSFASQIGARPQVRWWSLAVLASAPPWVWMGASMQTELPATAVLMALAAVLVRGGPDWVRNASILFAGLAALKIVHAVAALPLLLWALWTLRADLRWRHLPLALLIGVVLGASSYAQSWWLTGNPVLPLANQFFASPFHPVEPLVDARWHAGFGPLLLWQASFETTRFVESYPGGLGFTTLALAGALLLAVIRPERRGLALALLALVLVPLLPMQYLRYTWPGLLLLGVFLVVVAARELSTRTLGLSMLALCLLNLGFQASAGWTHNSVALKRLIRDRGEVGEVLVRFAPERVLLKSLPADDPRPVLATSPDRPFVAELGERGRRVMQHAPRLAAARVEAEADPSGSGWLRVFELSGAGWLLVIPQQASEPLRAGLERSGAVRSESAGDVELWRLPMHAEAQTAP
jgi:hypothetical protein